MKILVTGGSRGIGRAIVDVFKEHGHIVYSPTRDELDLSLPVRLKNIEFDVVVNNAGINPLNSIIKISDEFVMRVNYFSPLEIVQQCLNYMIPNRYGRIVNIGSIWIDVAKEDRLAYAASKSALHSLTKSLTVEYAKYGILTNTISPGFIETELTYQNNPNIKYLVDDIPVGRLGLPEEVAKMVYQLTVENTYICGQNIIMDGGYLCTAK